MPPKVGRSSRRQGDEGRNTEGLRVLNQTTTALLEDRYRTLCTVSCGFANQIFGYARVKGAPICPSADGRIATLARPHRATGSTQRLRIEADGTLIRHGHLIGGVANRVKCRPRATTPRRRVRAGGRPSGLHARNRYGAPSSSAIDTDPNDRRSSVTVANSTNDFERF